MAESQFEECPPELLADAIFILRGSEQRNLGPVDRLLGEYPRDARLHFLRGSLLADAGRYEEGRESLMTAVSEDPSFALARFQLGLLELTLGHARLAEAAWRPLEDLPLDNALRVFACGLCHMIKDEFPEALELLQKGIVLNHNNPSISSDMRLIINELEASGARANPGETTSAVHLLLQQYAKKRGEP